MTKLIFILTVLISSVFQSFAIAKEKTVLHVPFFVEITTEGSNPKYEYVPVAVFNKTLIAHGQKAQKEFVDVTMDTQVDAYEYRQNLNDAITAAGITNAQAFGESVPANWGDDENYTCYRGDGKDVADIVLNNTDNLYSDQYTLWAWKLGKTTAYVYAEEESDFESKAWAKYDTSSDSVIMLAAVGDEGTDENESIIPRCK